MGIENQDRTEYTTQTVLENNENQDRNIEEIEDQNVDDAEYTGMENNISNIENFIENINNEIASIDDVNTRTELENKITKIRQILSETGNETNTEINREIMNNMTAVYNIIDQYYNKLDISSIAGDKLLGNEKFQGRINALLDQNVTIDTILQIKEEIKNDEDKILLLLSLNRMNKLNDNDMLVLASLLGFECGEFLLQSPEGEEVKIPYINYIPNGYIIIIDGKIYYGNNEETAILNYTTKKTSAPVSYTYRLNTSKPKEPKEGEDPTPYDHNRYELGNKFSFKKSIFNITFTGYEKNKISGNSGGIQLKSGVGFNLSRTNNIGTYEGQPIRLTAYAGMYQNLLKSKGGGFEIETTKNVTIGTSIMRNNMSAGIGIEGNLNDGKTKYTADFARQVSDMVAIGANAGYEIGGNNPAGLTAGVGATINF